MSGSPKYSCAEIATTVVEQISSAVEQFRAAEAERARRRAEEQYRRNVDSTRRVLLSEIRALETSLHEHRQASYAQWTTGLARPSEVEFLARTAEAATELSALDCVRHQLTSATAAITRIVASAKSAEQCERARQQMERRHAESLAAMATAERALSEIDPELAAKFDPAGSRVIHNTLDTMRTAIGKSRFDHAIQCAEECCDLIAQHRDRILRAERDWLEHRRAAQTHLHETEILHHAALEDRIVMAWQKAEAERIGRTIDRATECIRREDWDAAATLLDSVGAELTSINKAALEREEEEAQRRYVARSVIAVLNEQGFYTDTPRLLSDDPNSDVIIQAVRSDQRCLQIGIQRQGRVRYEVDGASRLLTPGPDGKLAKQCPESEAALLALHSQLEKDFGITMDDLSWDGKPLESLSAATRDTSACAAGTAKEGAI